MMYVNRRQCTRTKPHQRHFYWWLSWHSCSSCHAEKFVPKFWYCQNFSADRDDDYLEPVSVWCTRVNTNDIAMFLKQWSSFVEDGQSLPVCTRAVDWMLQLTGGIWHVKTHWGLHLVLTPSPSVNHEASLVLSYPNPKLPLHVLLACLELILHPNATAVCI